MPEQRRIDQNSATYPVRLIFSFLVIRTTNKLGQNCLRFSGHFLINLIIILSFYIFHIDSRCNPRCENEAMCTSSGRCACRHGYTGQACQTGNIIILRLV